MKIIFYTPVHCYNIEFLNYHLIKLVFLHFIFLNGRTLIWPKRSDTKYPTDTYFKKIHLYICVEFRYQGLMAGIFGWNLLDVLLSSSGLVLPAVSEVFFYPESSRRGGGREPYPNLADAIALEVRLLPPRPSNCQKNWCWNFEQRFLP